MLHRFKKIENHYGELFAELLKKLSVKIEERDINKLHKIGKQTNEKTKPVLITFTKYNRKIEILRNRKKMLEPSYITQDFSKKTLKKRKLLQQEL